VSRAAPGRHVRQGRLVFACVSWAVSLAAFCLPFANPDLFWHLSAAKRILAIHAVPRQDWLSWSMGGRPWVDFEWLTQIVWFALFRAGGMRGLLALKALLFLGASLAFWKTLKTYGIGLAGRSLGLLAWTASLAPSNDLRPENFSLLFFSLEWLVLERRRLGRFSPGAWGRPAGAALFALWANLHPGFAYGLALLGVFAAAEIFRRRSWDLAWTGFWCALGALANPFGWNLYGVILEHARSMEDLQSHILEWGAPSVLNPWMAAFWVLLAAAFAAVLWRHVRSRDVPAEHWICLSFFALSAAAHARAIPYFCMVGAPVAALHLHRLAGNGGGPWKAATGSTAAALLGFYVFWFGKQPPFLRAFLPKFIPDRVASFLKAEEPAFGEKRMLNPWEWGGYLGYTLAPACKVFVDGRYIFHPFLRPMSEAERSPEAYQAFLQREGIDVVVQKRFHQFFLTPIELPGGEKLDLPRPYYVSFLPASRWALVYWSAQGLVFARRGAFPPDWIRGHEFKYFRPDDLTVAAVLLKKGEARPGAVREEVRRFERLNDGYPEAREAGLWEAAFVPGGARP